MRFCGLFLLFISICICRSAAQVVDYASHKEKIYLHTSHVFFTPGEDVFFKLYLVHAQDNTPSAVSNIVYVDVINPSGNVVQKNIYPVENGYAEGSYTFGEEVPGGIYKLRAYTAWMKNEKDSTFFVKELTLQQVISPRILMKLNLPQKGYGPGDEVTADFSARNLADRPVKDHAAKYTVSIGGQAHQTHIFQTDAEGKAKIKFRLPPSLDTNDGLLNISLQYDAYVEAISRSIPITLNRIDLQFMPEGGTLVAGIPANMAFKAVNEFGKPVDIKGAVYDQHGGLISSLESFHGGMGQFTFTPQSGNRYEAKITSPAGISKQYMLPNAAANGLCMQITPEGGMLRMKLTSTQNEEIKITGRTKDRLYFTQQIFFKKGTQTVTINPQLFPPGIARFTVSRANGLPLAERIVFLNGQKMLQVQLTADKNKYMPREKVTLQLKTLDESGNGVPSNFSLAVLDDKRWTLADDKQDHITSWLMMSSELKGRIEEPQFYFKKEEQKAPAALDLLMLTHGYRYFDYIPAVEKDGRLQFAPDVQNIITGMVRNGKGQPVKAKVWLAGLYGSQNVIQLVTGEDGVFYFPDLKVNENYFLVAQSLRSKEKVTVQVTENGIGTDRSRLSQYVINRPPEGTVPEMAVLPAGDMDEKRLQEVVVIGFGMQKSRMNVSGLAVTTQQEVLGATAGALLQGRVPGLAVVQEANPGQGNKIMIRGTTTLAGDNQPLIIVDGVPVAKLDGNLNPNEIASVYVLKNANATAIYGNRASYGVIIIETKKHGQKRIKWNLTPKVHYGSKAIRVNGPGYTPVRSFYAPQYTSTVTTERTDFRETIYWNPVVQTDNNGEASVSFYNSDATTTFRAIAEGIGFNGKVGRTETTYAVQHMLSLDAKIPPYLTVGDKALIPLYIKNNYAHPLHATIKAEFAESVQAGIFNKTIDIAPGASEVVMVPVSATSPVNGNMRFTVSSSQHTETISLPVSVVQKGFPVIETFAGTQSARHAYTIRKMVPGSLQYELKLFKSPEGQLLDGIASMLREPYGCFEQTSSATYPNVFILKYLRETGKVNPEVEQKAMDFIAKGYKKLISFETSAGGFEWFGKTPPQEALTAYGLMEFTDMQEFIAVDKQLLNRTKNYLLGRRDGNGGFLLASGGYDRFASVPNRIANIYIVYAFTHAGFGHEVLREYQHALHTAIQSNDAYQLSMMALAASNLKREKDFEQLMAILRQHYRQKTFKAETSVVNSRATSLEVETYSLYTLALARERSPDLPLMATLLSRIMAGKSYFGYSSTQATVLALNVVMAYARATGKAAAETQVTFLLNNLKIEPGKSSPGTPPAENNTFQAAYSQQGGNIPYNMEVAYFTYTPPNSNEAELQLSTHLNAQRVRLGETVRMNIAVKNEKAILQGMSVAKIGIPAGLSPQPWQLKELIEKNEVAYYEIFDNYLVLYWMGFAPNETKNLRLDLKAEIPGTYKAKAGNTYLYYMPEHKHWNDGIEVEVLP